MLKFMLVAALLGVCYGGTYNALKLGLRRAKGGPTVNVLNDIDMGTGTHLENDNSIEDLRQNILDLSDQMESLMVSLMEATKDEDMSRILEVKSEMEAVIPDLQVKWDLMAQILNITADLEDGLDAIENRWTEFVPHLPHSIAAHLAENIPHMTVPHNPVVLPDNPFTNTDTDESMEDNESMEDKTDYEQTKLNTEDLTKAIKTWEDVKAEFASLQTDFKELEVSKRAACSATPNLNTAVTDTNRIKVACDNGATCSDRIEDNANDVKNRINQFHRLRQKLDRVDSGLDGLNAVLIPLTRAPYVGAAASVIKNLLTPMRNSLNYILPKIQRVDRKLYPTWRDRASRLKTKAAKAERHFKKASKKAEALYNYLAAGRDCVCWMNPGTIKSNYQSSIDPSIGRPWHGGHLNTAITAYESVTGVCNEWDSFLSNLMSAMDISPLNGAIGTLDGLFNALGPLFDIFGEVNLALNRRLCMVNPLEVTREGAERVREAGERAAEWASERWEEGREGLTSWRRRRSLRKPFLTRSEARMFLATGLARSTRASQVCFSVMDIINGISSVFDFLLGWAQDILDAILASINFSLPGMPNLNFLNLNWLDLNFPNLNVDFELGLDVALPFITLSVPNLPNIPGLSMSLPNFNVEYFNMNWNPPTFSIPQHRCQPLGKK